MFNHAGKYCTQTLSLVDSQPSRLQSLCTDSHVCQQLHQALCPHIRRCEVAPSNICTLQVCTREATCTSHSVFTGPGLSRLPQDTPMHAARAQPDLQTTDLMRLSQVATGLLSAPLASCHLRPNATTDPLFAQTASHTSKPCFASRRHQAGICCCLVVAVGAQLSQSRH